MKHAFLCTFCLYFNFKLFQDIQLGLVQNTSALCKIQHQSITSSASSVACHVIFYLGCERISQGVCMGCSRQYSS